MLANFRIGGVTESVEITKEIGEVVPQKGSTITLLLTEKKKNWKSVTGYVENIKYDYTGDTPVVTIEAELMHWGK